MKFSPSSLLFFVAATLWLSCSCVVDAQISHQECADQGGDVVGDIGDGAISQPDYLCAINDEAPSDTVVAQDGEPIATEGEVCCGGTGEGIVTGSGGGGLEDYVIPVPSNAVRELLTRQECKDENGAVVGDIGNGAIHKEDYKCESNGLCPIGTIVPLEGEPIASEGEVCCGPVNAPLT